MIEANASHNVYYVKLSILFEWQSCGYASASCLVLIKYIPMLIKMHKLRRSVFSF
ncbi:hypothetical protein SAMN05216255_1290 [Pseudomonas segetis]|uniref:Uncharacterized protein n=1 Tax=Pseudomonas segetis TaxID=298908 RepID=A0A239ALY4_9PSED|nr:hypothetical protein SAMN05216255_1290 [Pseudomonas segetis]